MRKNFPVAHLLLGFPVAGEDCYVEFGVQRNKVYDVSLGEHLRINCPVKLCSNSTPAVTWYKLDETYVPISAGSISRIKTEFHLSNRLEGISYLIFENISRSDSGVYQCRSTFTVSHAIYVSIYGK